MNGGPSGFHNAPVTRTFVIASAILTILLGIQGRSKKLGLSYQDIFHTFRLWRFIGSLFAFSSTPELMFGLYLLYYFRVFERQIGSNKHSVFMFFSVILSSLFEILALTYLRDPSNVLVSGPYGLIFASFVPFYFDIPVSSRFRICGVQFSDKSFVYLAGLQLLFSSWTRSFIPGICGVLAGSLYRLNLLYIRKIKFPDVVASSFSRLPWPLPATSSHISSGSNSENVPLNASHQMEGNYQSAARASAPELASETSVATLVSMGFDRNSARQALIHAGDDINLATNILLEAQSH
ncbi:rhomboid-like protein 20 [Asparagus officinalis]|uniref:rhomboid-like protein 20 n=1 Tax=Asparagus officinalis TaxID=4686 RepID=UPI00098E282A|nr:rhomboid-like protein 20 [Asparagus officinalis]